MSEPRITDNDHGEISASVNGKEIRGWSYKDDAERRMKMLMAHEFAEGWFQCKAKGDFKTAERLKQAEWVLEHSGFRRCDIMACNCGSWHQVGGFKARFDEIKEVVEEAGYSTNGRTLLAAVKRVASDARCLRSALQKLVRLGTDGRWRSTQHGDADVTHLVEFVLNIHEREGK